MAVELSWYEEGRVVVQQFSGTLDEDDVREVARTLKHHADNGVAPVHTIVDVRRVTDVPATLDQINRLRTDANMAGWMIVVGLHPAVRFFARLVSQLRGLNYRPVSTLEDALYFLAHQDSALVHLAGLPEMNG
jgi:hypothetical protein